MQIAVGGGSTIGLGKALALHSDGRIKQIVIPTTCRSPFLSRARRRSEAQFCRRHFADAGSEATPIIGQSETDAKGQTLKTTQKTTKV